MIVELRGVEFVNKGAELMLHAILQKVKEKYPNAIFVMAVRKRVPAQKLKEFNISVKKHKWKAKLIPRFIRRKIKIGIEKEITVVLDGSGFAFGDQWGKVYANNRLGLQIADWRKEGKKIILLPQAFGPFNKPEVRAVMKDIIANANLIFAREQQSYDYLKNILDKDTIKLAPDFTNLIAGKVPPNFDTTNRQVAIIPNNQMIAQKGEEGKFYINFLCVAINKIISLGLKPYFLIHEDELDIEIAKKVNTLLEKPLEIINNPHPLVIKGIISTAYFIVCSRFHGVVSALSQGVPCISTSWSHKYEMLHQEYDFKEGIISNVNDREEIEQKIARLADPETNKIISEKLKWNSATQKQRSAEMWNTVFKVMSEN